MSSIAERAPSAGSTGDGGPGWVPGPLAAERLLWTAVVLIMMLDVATTGVGLRQGLSEGNPVMAGVIERAGLAGLALAKGAVLGVGAVARLCLPGYRLVIPLGLAAPGAIAVLVNALLLAGA